MIIKIGGIEIDKASNISDISQLRVGIEGLDINNPIDGLSWLKDLSLEDKLEFISIVSDYGLDNMVSFFTFGML